MRTCRAGDTAATNARRQRAIGAGIVGAGGMMGKGAKAVAMLYWACAAMGAVTGPVFAQNKELSDKSVLTLMRYAWTLVPEKFTTPLGKTIIVDKSKSSEATVPVDIAREVIRVARLSAYAQLCELAEEQRANF